MKYIAYAAKIIALGLVVAAWLFGLQLAYDAHMKQMALAAWMGGLQACQKKSSYQAPQRETGTWQIDGYSLSVTPTPHFSILTH